MNNKKKGKWYKTRSGMVYSNNPDKVKGKISEINEKDDGKDKKSNNTTETENSKKKKGDV